MKLVCDGRKLGLVVVEAMARARGGLFLTNQERDGESFLGGGYDIAQDGRPVRMKII